MVVVTGMVWGPTVEELTRVLRTQGEDHDPCSDTVSPSSLPLRRLRERPGPVRGEVSLGTTHTDGTTGSPRLSLGPTGTDGVG